MSLFNPPTTPSPLGRYRLLSPNCGVRVSPLCLVSGKSQASSGKLLLLSLCSILRVDLQGAMSLGEAWKDSPMISGGLDKKGEKAKRRGLEV